MSTLITREKLLEILRYDPETGKFYWRVNRKSVKEGDEAGCLNHHGYIRISTCGRQYQAHILAWLYMTGKWPEKDLDHKNLLRSDNRWDNLRLSSKQESSCNRGMFKNNKSGIKGVCWRASTKKWRAYIYKDYKCLELGSFELKENAEKAVLAARVLHHGEFANQGTTFT